MSFIVNYQAGGRIDYPFQPTLQKPIMKSINLEMDSPNQKYNEVLYLDTEAEITSVGIIPNNFTIGDYWNMWIGDKLICDEIYVKNVSEGIFLMVVYSIQANEPIEIEYYNKSGKKNNWFVFNFLVPD